MGYAHTLAGTRYTFDDLRTLLARATPSVRATHSPGSLAGRRERVAARWRGRPAARHDPGGAIVPYETDEVTRLIIDTTITAFAPVAALTVGEFREFLSPPRARRSQRKPRRHAGNGGRGQQVDAPAGPDRGCGQVPRRNPVPQHHRAAGPHVGAPAAEPSHRRSRGVAAATLDGLLLGAGDAVIGVNPATDSVEASNAACHARTVRDRYAIPTQTCVLAHVTTTLRAIERGAPVDLVFQSIAGTEAANTSFGITGDYCARRGKRRCRCTAAPSATT